VKSGYFFKIIYKSVIRSFRIVQTALWFKQKCYNGQFFYKRSVSQRTSSKEFVTYRSNTNREVGSSLFGFQDGLTIVSFVPKNNKAVLLLTSKHHDSQVDNKTGKPIVILDYNKTKGAVDTFDQLCHRFYGMIDIAGINAMLIWKAKNPQWNQNIKHKRRLFLEELGLALVSHQLDFRSKNSKFLNVDIQNALAIVGYPVMKRNISIINENSTQAKRKRCSFCERSTDKKTSTQRLFVMNILLSVFFVTLAANKECHLNNFFLGSNRKKAYFIKRLVPKYEKIFYENINC
jgi:hypothetical protein